MRVLEEISARSALDCLAKVNYYTIQRNEKVEGAGRELHRVIEQLRKTSDDPQLVELLSVTEEGMSE